MLQECFTYRNKAFVKFPDLDKTISKDLIMSKLSGCLCAYACLHLIPMCCFIDYMKVSFLNLSPYGTYAPLPTHIPGSIAHCD